MKPKTTIKIGYIIGFLPLIIGSIVFFTWYFTQADFLISTGLIIIPVFLIICMIGLILIIRLFFINNQFRIKAILPMLVILLNIPVAYGYISWAEIVLRRVYVVIENKSTMKLDSLVIDGRNESKFIGEINPETTRTVYFYPVEEIGYYLKFLKGSSKLKQNIGYVVPGDIYDIIITNDTINVNLRH